MMERDSRPVFAVVVGELPPYRVHWHHRIAHEIPELRLRTVLFPFRTGTPWKTNPPPEIDVVTFSPSRPAVINSAWDWIRTFVGEWRESIRVLGYLNHVRPSAVMVNGYSGPPFHLVIAWCKWRGVPSLIWTDSNIHGEAVRQGLLAKVKRRASKALMRMATTRLSCGRAGAEFFKLHTSIRQHDSIFYCPYEPDYELIATTPTKLVRSTATRFQLDSGRRRFVACNRLVPVKRTDTIIDAFVKIAEARPEWDLVIVGQGPERERLEAMVPETLRSRVIWVGFVGEQEVVNALYRNCDCLVLASDYEPWALVVNEAAAAGLALVCTYVVGAAIELLREGVNGRFFRPRDVEGLAASMLSVSQTDTIDRMKAASPEVVAEWRRNADPIAGLRRALESMSVLRPAESRKLEIPRLEGSGVE
jgi:glycosyltransferase involved in cell wall biosynthesis